MRTPSLPGRRPSLFALSLIALLTLGGCRAPQTIRVLVPTTPTENIDYQSWEAWTHPESGQVYRVPRMLLLGFKYEWAMGPHYREIMYADLADLLREQAWIQAAIAARDKASAEAKERPRGGLAGDLDGE